MKVAIQGIRGSFHDQAARDYFGDEPELIECMSFADVFTSVDNGTAEYGVVAVENSLYGSINQVYRLLAERNLWVCGEVRLHIALCLIGHTTQDVSELDRADVSVLSHFAALGQCERWLATNLPRAQHVDCADTALAVQQIMQNNTEQQVAIASAQAAELYGATILATPINDDLDNYTRFFVICKEPIENERANRTSIILNEPDTDKPGTLYDALGIFSAHNVNLSKLDSHPKPGKKRTYSFYIDCDESATSTTGKQVLAELREHGWDIQILGTYIAQ